jgi:1,4-dihydroxy-2-naphthoate octaprenyltransferase
MTKDIIQNDRTMASIWIQATRPFAFSASVIPVLVGSVGAVLLAPSGSIDWYLLPVILIAAVLFHTGGNLVSEYFDFKKSVDRQDTYGSSRVLVDALLTPNQILNAGILTFVFGFLLGLFLVYVRGLDILYLGLAGLIAGVFYTMKPFEFKYYALGDILIFFAFGPLLVLGSFFGLTGFMNWDIVWISIPISFLVVGIVHANNTRDIFSDTRAKVRTLASVVGINGAKFEYYFLVIGAYTATIILIAFGFIEWYAAAVVITIPVAIKNMKEIAGASVDKPEAIAMLDVKTAQLHMQFGLLYTIGILLSGLL